MPAHLGARPWQRHSVTLAKDCPVSPSPSPGFQLFSQPSSPEFGLSGH